MNKEKLVPKLRFGQFKNNDEWKKESIGNLVTIGSGVSPVKFKHGDYLYVKVNDLNFSSRYQLNTVTRVSFNGNANLINKNSIVFPKRGAAILTNKVRILKENSYMDTNMMALTPQKINSDFLYSFISKTSLYKIADTSTIPQINNKHLEPYQIYIPNSSEQYKIGFFFKKIDQMIQLQQSKVNKVKDIKSAYLSEMFPKEGEKYPKKRFGGFSGKWEQVQVQEIFRITRGYVLSATKVTEYPTTEMKYPVYSSQTKKDGLMGYYDEYLYEDSITWTTDGANAGTVSYRPGKFYCTNVSGVLISNEGYANKMVAEALNQIAWKHVSKVGNPKLMNNIMAEIVISMPQSIKEQNQISQFINNLDNQISIEEEKLAKLEKLKQAYLNDMFV